MGIIRLSELEPWIGVQKPAEESGTSPLDAAWAKASAVAATVDTAAAAFGGLDKAANDLTGGDAPPAEWTRRFDEAVGKLPADALPDEDFADFQALARMRGNRLKVDAVRRQHADVVDRFQDAVDGYVQKAADAPSNAVETAFRRQAIRAIERIDGAGLLGPGVADKLRAELPARIDRALALRVIERDPAHAAALLTQPGALPALDDAERSRLARKAGLRAERQSGEKSLAEERNRQRAVTELWLRRELLDDADIDAAEADGRLLAGDARVLRARVQADRIAHQQRTDSVARVRAANSSGGALDPASPADRKAVDAHFAEAERTWDEDQVPADRRPALIAAHVGTTGILPPALGKRIGAAFRAGDVTRQNEAADIVEAIGQSPGRKVLVGLPVEDLLQSALILSLRENGLEPEAAAARATAILDGDAQARDHNFRRDLAAAGDWVEGSGCFDIEQIITLREQFDGLRATEVHSAEPADLIETFASGEDSLAGGDKDIAGTADQLRKKPSDVLKQKPPIGRMTRRGLIGLSILFERFLDDLDRRLKEHDWTGKDNQPRDSEEESRSQAVPLTVPAPPQETKLPNIPPAGLPATPGGSAGPRVQGPPAADSPDRNAKPIVNPGFGADFADILEHYLLREDNRGSPSTVKGNKVVAQECRKVLEEQYPKYAGKVEHTGGSYEDGKDPTDDKETYQKEETIKSKELGVHRRADLTYDYEGQKAHINTVTTLKDGVTPTAAEQRARDDIAKVANNIIETVGKLKKDDDEEEYRKKARQTCQSLFKDLLGEPEEEDVPEADDKQPDAGSD